MLVGRRRAARVLEGDRRDRGDRPRRLLRARLRQRDGGARRARARAGGHRQLRGARPDLRGGARDRPGPGPRGHLHARPRRSRLRAAAVPRRGGREGLAAAPDRRPPERGRPLRPLPRHARLQRAHQRAAVLHPGLVAHRVRLPRHGLRSGAAPRDRRRGARAAARAGRDRRRHVGVVARAAHPVDGRPLHLGRAQRGQSAEGPALRRGVGGGAPRDGGARRGAAHPRPRHADRRAPSACGRRSPTPRSGSRRW